MKSVFPWKAVYNDKNINNEVFKKTCRRKKLISRSKKKMENFIRTKLRIITREQTLRNRTAPPVRDQSTVISS